MLDSSLIVGDSSSTSSCSMPVCETASKELVALNRQIATLLGKAEKTDRPFPKDNWTNRRDSMAMGSHLEAQRLYRYARVFQNIVEQAQVGCLPVDVAHILLKMSTPVLTSILWQEHFPVGEYNKDINDRLSKIGVTSFNYARVREVLQTLDTGLQNVEDARKMWEQKTRIQRMIGNSLDFFPTPENIADLMVEAAEAEGFAEPFHFCEPSAGTGNLMHALLKKYEPTTITAIEVSYELVEYLKVQKFDTNVPVFVLNRDFLQTELAQSLWVVRRDVKGFDLILMNPPFRFEQEHVRHAYDLLSPDGILVSVMSAGIKFINNNKTRDFRNWLEDGRGYFSSLPASSFASSGTGVSSILVTIRK